jgi:predicted dehydrogenase
MHKVGIVGGGTMGKVHAECWSKIPNAKVVGIADIQFESAQLLASKHDAMAFASIEDMLRREEIDILGVCTPTPYHREQVLMGLAAGKHVFTEKPLALNLEEGQEILHAARKSETEFMVGHVVRFFHEYRAAKAIIDSGEIGKIGIVRTTRTGSHPIGWNDWFGNSEMSGGVAQDMVIHDFDFLRWCFGEVKRVYAKLLTYKKLYHTDYVLATLRFKSGIIAHCEGSWAHQPGTFYTRIEVAGDKGMLEFDSRKSVPVQISPRKTEGTVQTGVMIPESPMNESPYLLQLKHFVDCIDGTTQPLITPEDAYEALRISLAVMESARTGSPVALN